MARCGIFQGLRRRGAALAAFLAYALLLNALTAALFNVQAIAAALDPLTQAATCDGSGSQGDPARHDSRHQPDCTLCGPACPMGGPMQGLAGAATPQVPAPQAVFAPSLGTPRASRVHPQSVYLSDGFAQAPPARG
jgi:hypothetical protein